MKKQVYFLHSCVFIVKYDIMLIGCGDDDPIIETPR